MDSKQEVIKLDQLVAAGVKLTPMFVQYHEVKKSYPDMLLLFRMGDFYELFFEDAVIAANTLGITLTYRGKLGDHKIPMAGIPHHAANNYVDRLTGCGMKLAICEQVEDPKEAKGIVKRAVTQVVTPGMPYDLEKSEQSIRHYMCAAFQQDDHFYLTALDYTTGEFSGHSLNSEQELIQKLEILDPKEFITYLGQWDNLINLSATLTQLNLLKTHLSQEYFLPKYSANYIEKLIPGFNQDQIIQLNQGIIPAIGALSYYIDSAQGVGLPVHIHPFKMVNSQGEMRISMPTLKGLEIIPNHRDNYKDSLLGFFDRTKSAIGSRRLKQLFTTPLTDLELISQRAGTIEKLVATPSLLVVVRQQLALTRDLERILAKLSSGKITACDLLALATTVMVFKELIPKLQALTSSPPWSLLANREYTQLTSFATKIESALNPEPGASLEKGNLIMPSFSAARDRLSTLCSGRTMELMELEERYRQETGIKKLKIKSNNVHGHFIEVSNSQQHLVPTYFERRQTLVNCERYTTKELNKFEQEVVYAQERLEQLERKLFKELTGELSTLAPLIMQLAELIGQVDSFASIAQISLEEEFVRPTFSNKKRVLEVKGGHHPLIKAAIRERFVPHDLYLDQEHFFGLITGPNMAG
ncbi:MAG: DNA mismatch repair protein MutS, partial [Bdellovibrionales bacterium]|nr:DNA mismatch repair protein MutS [Bdellovibrionales bacterium]